MTDLTEYSDEELQQHADDVLDELLQRNLINEYTNRDDFSKGYHEVKMSNIIEYMVLVKLEELDYKYDEEEKIGEEMHRWREDLVEGFAERREKED